MELTELAYESIPWGSHDRYGSAGPWIIHGTPVGLARGSRMGLPCMGLPWVSHGPPTGLSWVTHGSPMGLPWVSHRFIALAHGPPMTLKCWLVGSPWNSQGTTVVPRDSDVMKCP